jgi:ABC-type branched-subunit amino acid transport system ATPase component
VNAEAFNDAGISSVQRCLDALRSLIGAREAIDPPPKRFVDQWWNLSEQEIETRLKQVDRLSFRQRRWLRFLRADLLAAVAEGDPRDVPLRTILLHLAHGYLMVAQDNDAPYEVRRAAAAAVVEIGSRSRIPKWIREQAVRIVDDAQVDDAFYQMAIGVSSGNLRELLKAAQEVLRAPPYLLLNEPEAELAIASGRTADMLGEAISIRDRKVAAKAGVDYDTSDAALRVRAVHLQAFRGSPLTLDVDLCARTGAVSALIFGDNGAGKSTIADAIEFGLQGRVGRSTLYDSPVGPSLRSFASEEGATPYLRIDLSDGSSVERSVEVRQDGVSVQLGDPIRPGFRLAPITLKRQDILRFLDTDGLARGQLFFDYFPASVDEMALRPEEKLQSLDHEAYDLRIRRTVLGERLAQLLNLPEAPGSRDQLLSVVKSSVTDGLDIDRFDWEQVDPEILAVVSRLLNVMDRLKAIKKAREAGVELLNPVRYKSQAAILAAELAPLGEEITRAFKLVTKADFIERIDVLFGVSGPIALDVVVELTNGTRCFPQQLFSEGYRDLVAVLFFTSVAKRAALRGQAKILILDDVFQSVDAGIRADVMNYLLDDFYDWQLIITVHDRLWMENLRALFRLKNHTFTEVHLRQWRYATGPQLAGQAAAFLADRVKRALDDDDPATICGVAGRALEELCDNLSWRLRVSVQRQPQDKYTLGDLWPGVRKALRRTSADDAAERVGGTVYLRNVAGAHFNEWAQSLSLTEATAFGSAVIKLLEATFCRSCGSWVSLGKGTNAACVCGTLKV